MSDSISIRTVPGSRDDLAAEFPSNVYGAGALRNIPLQLRRREFLRRDDETGPQSLDRPGRYAVVTGIEGGDEVMAAIKVFSKNGRRFAHFKAPLGMLREHANSHLIIQIGQPMCIHCELSSQATAPIALRQVSLSRIDMGK